MRIWSLHPEYLDSRGLVALWREALLAQAVLRGQLDYEWDRLLRKVKKRDKEWSIRLESVELPRPHPQFRVIPGDIEEWERVPVRA